MSGSISPYVGLAIAAGLMAAWRGWVAHRNGLPDDERARIYWNDQRYERLQRGITIGLWVWFGAMLVGAAGVVVYFWYQGA